VPLEGGTPTQLATTKGHAEGIAVHSTSVYWTNRTNGMVLTVLK
jgi:hypothetical protein